MIAARIILYYNYLRWLPRTVSVLGWLGPDDRRFSRVRRAPEFLVIDIVLGRQCGGSLLVRQSQAGLQRRLALPLDRFARAPTSA